MTVFKAAAKLRARHRAAAEKKKEDRSEHSNQTNIDGRKAIKIN